MQPVAAFSGGWRVRLNVARALMTRLRADLGPGPITPQPHTASEILRGPAFEIYGNVYPPFASFLPASGTST